MRTEEPEISDELRAPFPWFGGKRRVAELVWSRLGDVQSYNEPFAGSLAVLLARPHQPRVETVNDLDCYLANFWRALQHDPDGVAYHADGPVNEADLHARHRWLVEQGRAIAERVMIDADFFDSKIAGWWVWGQCLWIGSGWCASGPKQGIGSHWNGAPVAHQRRRPALTNDNGVIIQRHANGANLDLVVDWQPRPDLSAANGRGGVMGAQRTARTRSEENPSGQRKRPVLPERGNGPGVHRRWQGGGQGGGSGVHAPRLSQQVPEISGSRGATGRGVHRKLPALRQGGNDHSGNGRGVMSEAVRSTGLYDYLAQLSARLRRVRVCCGDWKRVLTPSVTTYIGTCGVFLDPPYSHELRERCYSEDHDISAEVCAWALEHGDNPDFRIALCGYAGEHDMPASWECVPWKAHGGYSRSVRGVANRSRERIWFSPHCLKPGLFGAMSDEVLA